MKVGWKIFFLCMSVYIIALTLSSVLITENTYSTLLKGEVQRFLKEEAKIYSFLPSFLPAGVDGDSLEKSPNIESYTGDIANIIKTNLLENEEVYIAIYSEDSRMLFSNFKERNHIQGEELKYASDGYRNYVLRRINGTHYIFITDVLYITDELQIDTHKLIISLIKDISYIDHQRQLQYMSFIQTGALGLLVVVILTPFMSRLVLRPINKLTEGVRDITSGNYQYRVSIKSKDEIGVLAHQFNIMAEEVEKKIDELKQEGKIKQRFIDNLTHELRTPLTSIIGYAELLKVIEYDEKVFYKSLQYIHSEGKRVLRLVNNLMNMILFGKNDIHMEEVHSQHLLEEIANIMKIKSDKKNTHIYIRGREMKFIADRDMIKELLINLVDNAINASSPGEDIIIGTKLIKKRKCIYIEDKGKGIPEEEIQKILEPFYRINKSRSRMDGGVGLGLSICSEIVKLHGASMEIDSEIGRGTEVRVIFNI